MIVKAIFRQQSVENCRTLKTVHFWTVFRFAATYHPRQLALEEVMENFGELMQRLLENQTGGTQRSPELLAEDERLMEGLQKRHLAGKPRQTVKFSQE